MNADEVGAEIGKVPSRLNRSGASVLARLRKQQREIEDSVYEQCCTYMDRDIRQSVRLEVDACITLQRDHRRSREVGAGGISRNDQIIGRAAVPRRILGHPACSMSDILDGPRES